MSIMHITTINVFGSNCVVKELIAFCLVLSLIFFFLPRNVVKNAAILKVS